jgi:hypothetical protein
LSGAGIHPTHSEVHSLKTMLVTSKAAILAAALLLHVSPLAAQQTPPSPPPETAPPVAASPTPAPPPPLPILMQGPALDTLRALAAALQTEAQHGLAGTQAAADAGLRPSRMFMPGLRMFARRTEWLRNSIDTYREQPFDVVSSVSGMSTRVRMLTRRLRQNPALEHTREDWDNVTDLLDRMQKVLAGETVTVPPPHTPRPAPTPLPSPSPTASPAPSPSASPSPTPPPR